MRRSACAHRALVVGLGAALLIGCAEAFGTGSSEILGGATIKPVSDFPGHPGISADDAAHVRVPFYPDDSDQCGPATLASILTYWGIPSDPTVLKEETYIPRLRGTLPIDLLLAVQARGLHADGSRGTLESLKAELDAQHPVVALLNLGWAILPQGHYVVITGYDESRRGLYMHSGLSSDVFVSYSDFLTDWEKTGRWMLRVQPMERRATTYE